LFIIKTVQQESIFHIPVDLENPNFHVDSVRESLLHVDLKGYLVDSYVFYITEQFARTNIQKQRAGRHARTYNFHV
jgi:phosphoribulokinase